MNLIFSRHDHSRLVFSGDFNERLGEVTDMLQHRKLLPQIAQGVSIHSRGGHLDQVFSNLECMGVELKTLPNDISDHVKITCIFKIDKSENDYNLSNPKLIVS